MWMLPFVVCTELSVLGSSAEANLFLPCRSSEDCTVKLRFQSGVEIPHHFVVSRAGLSLDQAVVEEDSETWADSGSLGAD